MTMNWSFIILNHVYTGPMYTGKNATSKITTIRCFYLVASQNNLIEQLKIHWVRVFNIRKNSDRADLEISWENSFKLYVVPVFDI